LGKGSRAERELVNKFWAEGCAVMRSPSSGSGRKHPQPDILVSDGSDVLCMEIKATGSDSVYLEKDEIKKLKKFCELFGDMAVPLIAVKWDYQGWTFHHPSVLSETKKSYKVDRKTESIDLL
jgi:Holliday junction resolvase